MHVLFRERSVSYTVSGGAIRMDFVRATSALPEGVAEHGRFNAAQGRDASKSTANVPLYEKVTYRQIYKGIDLVYGGALDRLKSEYVLAQGRTRPVFVFGSAMRRPISHRARL